ANRLVEFEQNLRSRQPAVSRRLHVVEPDPSWDAQAHRIMARVNRAAGELAVRVDHIGSTAVTGVPTRDVLDLQLTVRRAQDWSELCAALGDAGFPHLH